MCSFVDQFIDHASPWPIWIDWSKLQIRWCPYNIGEVQDGLKSIYINETTYPTFDLKYDIVFTCNSNHISANIPVIFKSPSFLSFSRPMWGQDGTVVTLKLSPCRKCCLLVGLDVQSEVYIPVNPSF